MKQNSSILFLCVGNEILFLKRPKDDRAGYGNLLTLPGGKQNKEDFGPAACLKREVKEEIKVELPEFQPAKNLYDIDENEKYIMFFYWYRMETKPEIILSNEHTSYVWANIVDIFHGAYDEKIAPLTLKMTKKLFIELSDNFK